MIVNNPFQLIGNTPMIHLNKLSKKMNCNIYLKLEKYNLTGSSKDRAVYNMIQELIDSKKIKLSKEQQLKMLEFFVKTSVPRMLQSSKEQK